ncbi:hypothetical protein [Litoreibacter albidus]|uniref:Uncharacterized protein n=1 Tax=Litoreibacter albidus TaxID=670155 RepID=A0A1H2SLJ7_9RHOB|nr:hypothetical protein [Litoreibacter albidus]SDW31919.1 hypothetical protein SAMN04488001_0839 [Litoreibacter albidus]
MSLLSQHLSGLSPIPARPISPLAAIKTGTAISPLLSAQARQSQIKPVAPVAASTVAAFAADQPQHSALRDRGQHELQALLRNMQGIDHPTPKGERVDLLVPRPTDLPPP